MDTLVKIAELGALIMGILILFLCLLYTFSQKRLKTLYNTFYTVLLGATELGLLLELYAALNYLSSTILGYILRTALYILILCYLYTYMKSKTDFVGLDKRVAKAYIVAYVCHTLYVVIVQSGVEINYFFYCLFPIMYFVGLLVVLLRSWDSLTLIDKLSTSLSILVIIPCILIDMLQVNEYVDLLCYIIIVLICAGNYMALQNPQFYIDKNTNLLNKDAFDAVAVERLVFEKPFKVILLSLKDYNVYRGIYNTDFCNALLQEVKTYLTSINKHCTVYYYQNADFLIELPANVSSGKLKTEISKRFQNTWSVFNYNLKLEVGLVGFNYPEHVTSLQQIDTLLHYSLQLVHENKGTVSFDIEEDLMKEIEKSLQIEYAVKRCIERDDIMIFYQPIYNNTEKGFKSAEALARMYDDELGIISPMEFISIAEKSGLIVQLGTQIFTKVCEFVASHDLDKMGIDYIEVNVSPIQIAQTDFASKIINITKQLKVNPKRLNLEITETAKDNNMQLLRKNLNELLEAGFTFSLDDYGTCNSNLENILLFPFHIIKLDRCLIRAYLNSENGFLPYLIAMLKNEGYTLVAEGVESKEEAAIIMSMGVDNIQGYCYSKPISEGDYVSFVNFWQDQIKI